MNCFTLRNQRFQHSASHIMTVVFAVLLFKGLLQFYYPIATLYVQATVFGNRDLLNPNLLPANLFIMTTQNIFSGNQIPFFRLPFYIHVGIPWTLTGHA